MTADLAQQFFFVFFCFFFFLVGQNHAVTHRQARRSAQVEHIEDETRIRRAAKGATSSRPRRRRDVCRNISRENDDTTSPLEPSCRTNTNTATAAVQRHGCAIWCSATRTPWRPEAEHRIAIRAEDSISDGKHRACSETGCAARVEPEPETIWTRKDRDERAARALRLHPAGDPSAHETSPRGRRR